MESGCTRSGMDACNTEKCVQGKCDARKVTDEMGRRFGNKGIVRICWVIDAVISGNCGKLGEISSGRVDSWIIKGNEGVDLELIGCEELIRIRKTSAEIHTIDSIACASRE